MVSFSVPWDEYHALEAQGVCYNVHKAHTMERLRASVRFLPERVQLLRIHPARLPDKELELPLLQCARVDSAWTQWYGIKAHNHHAFQAVRKAVQSYTTAQQLKLSLKVLLKAVRKC